MQINYRSYPYPVLSHFSDDYEKCAFQTSVSVSSSKTAYILAVNNALSDAKLKEFVESGEAHYGLHVECKSTRYRILYSSKDPKFEVQVPADSVNGAVEICCLLVASNKIADYKNSNFHKDFGGHSFSVEKGDVLAVAQDRVFEADNYLDQMKKIPSIFSICANSEKNPSPIAVHYGDTKITIKLPTSTYERYRYLKGDQNLQRILAAMIIVPILVDIISDIKADYQDFIFNNGDMRWFKSIKNRLAQIGYPVEGPDIETDSAVLIANLLIEDPLSGGIADLEGIMEEQE